MLRPPASVGRRWPQTPLVASSRPRLGATSVRSIEARRTKRFDFLLQFCSNLLRIRSTMSHGDLRNPSNSTLSKMLPWESSD